MNDQSRPSATTTLLERPSALRVIPTSSILLNERQRKEIKPDHIHRLKLSILTKGLLHPIVLCAISDSPTLVAGECRLRAITELHEDGLQPTHQGLPIPRDTIPYVTVSELSEADIAEAELEENLLRAPLTWQEEVRAKALIHRLRVSENPTQTRRETANEIASIKGTHPETERNVLHRVLLVNDHLDKPAVATAANLSAAHRIVVDEAERSFKAGLVRQKIITSSHQILLGDCREILPHLTSGEIDAIICDPPYGMNAHKMKKDELHLYDDRPEYALEIAEFILREGFRLLRPRGTLFLFCDIDHYVHLREVAKQHCYSTWRTPLIWRKGDDGHAPWGRSGFIRTYEMILFAVKGQKELNLPGGPDVLDFSRTGRARRVHAAEKPVMLLEKLLSLSTLQGDRVLDPCCGSGPILDAATNLRLQAIAIEKDPDYHREALARIAEGAINAEDPDHDLTSDLLS